MSCICVLIDDEYHPLFVNELYELLIHGDQTNESLHLAAHSKIFKSTSRHQIADIIGTDLQLSKKRLKNKIHQDGRRFKQGHTDPRPSVVIKSKTVSDSDYQRAMPDRCSGCRTKFNFKVVDFMSWLTRLLFTVTDCLLLSVCRTRSCTMLLFVLEYSTQTNLLSYFERSSMKFCSHYLKR
ncbi:hypothetical protein DFA_04361 [Cavenderia fasciculata]|uniref:Uncharacterized protein n=1 Tax=Cavenderia fasciculata TaxID=261658 RepID=F4PPD0_CACFS|nr:uncharacterized protein DFA_04361 [Cavenderia fasciculata]EGG22243.1 hypothetical protein DFA_04361 [Cavenderia fasciculata]|eukprot:XP_004360094.1 hypothetical protein DFA_04361 [Cavenderia fasciculata]